jgi:hypothetical protein
LSSSSCSSVHSPVTSSLLDPSILLNTLFSNNLSLRSSPQYERLLNYHEVEYRNSANNKHVVIAVAVAAAAVAVATAAAAVVAVVVVVVVVSIQ